MYPAPSPQWHESLQGDFLQAVELEVAVDLTDIGPIGPNEKIATEAQAMSFANLDNVLRAGSYEGTVPTVIRSTVLEQNRVLLDGSFTTFTASSASGVRYAAPQPFGSTATGEAVFKVNFLEGSDASGWRASNWKAPVAIEIVWDSAAGEYPLDVDIRARKQDSSYTNIAEGYTADSPVSSIFLGANLGTINQIEITVKKWCLPNHRPRIDSFFLGLRKRYSGDEIISCKSSQRRLPLAIELPRNELRATFSDPDGDLDPNNPNGLVKYIDGTTPRPVHAQVGCASQGRVDWILIGSYYVQDWTSRSDSTQTELAAQDVLSVANQGSYKGCVYVGTSSTAHSLGLSGENYSSVTERIKNDIYDAFKVAPEMEPFSTWGDKKCYAPLPDGSYASMLQIIANANGRDLWCDRTGRIRWLPYREKANPVFTIMRDDMLDSGAPCLAQAVAKLAAKNTTWMREKSTAPLDSEVARLELYGSVGDTVDIGFSSAVDPNTIQFATSDLEWGALDEPTVVRLWNYGVRVRLRKPGTNRFRVAARTLLAHESTSMFDIAATGQIVDYDNPLDSTAAAQFAHYLSNRVTLTPKLRLDPRLDAGDFIEVETEWGLRPALITSIDYDYSAAVYGTLSVVVFEDMDSSDTEFEILGGEQ